MNEYHKALAGEIENRIYEIPEAKDGKFLLDDHQTDAMVETSEALLKGEKAFSVVHSCGAGKTAVETNMLLASQAVKLQLGMDDHPDIILTTERALIHSIGEELRSFDLDVGVWTNGKKVLDRSSILTTVQTLQWNRHNLAKLIPIDRVPMIIGDEADKYLTDLRKGIIKKFNNALRMGFTATAEWPDGRDISDLWGRKIHELPLKEGISTGVNVAPLFYLFEAGFNDENISIKGGDYDQKELTTALKEAEIEKGVLDTYKMLVPENKRKEFPTMIFVPSRNLVHDVVENFKREFAGQNFVVRGWTGDTVTHNQLKNDIRDYNDGKIDALVLCQMGGRGLNLPRARVLIDGAPTMSPNKLEQRDGRPLRRVRPESKLGLSGFRKNFSIIAQIIPQSNRFRPYLLPDLLDCWDDFKEGRLLGVTKSQGSGIYERTGEENFGASVQAEIKEIRDNIKAQGHSPHVTFVDKVDVYQQLKLRNDLPRANKDGFFIGEDGEKYGTAEAWAKKFQVNQSHIALKLKQFKSLKGKTSKNSIRDFYKECDVNLLGAFISKKSPIKYREKFTIIDGVKHASRDYWAKHFGISKTTMNRRTPKGTKSKYRGRTGGAIFSEKLIRSKIKDLIIEKDHIADENGFIEKSGERYATITTWGKELGLSGIPIIDRLPKNLKSIKGKSNSGHIETFFSEKDIENYCKDIIERVSKLPQANKKGFFKRNKIKYGTVWAWARELEVSSSTIDRKLRKTEKNSHIKGLVNNTEYDFYPEYFIREILAKTLALKNETENLPEADKEGFIYKHNKKYGTLNAWRRVYKRLNNVDDFFKEKLSKAKGLEVIKGVSFFNKYDFYSEEFIKSIL